MADYQLIRSKRKTLALVVSREGVLEARAPMRLSKAAIDRFVVAKQDWIEEKQAEMRRRAAERTAFQVGIGSCLPFLGQALPVEPGDKPVLTGEAFLVDPERPVKPQIIGLYRQAARREMEERLRRFAPLVGAEPASLRITGASTRFGSCSGRNGISFTWKLMLAPPELADYVAVHELCHILQHNHSPRFWKEVERVLPDYREREQALRAFGRSLQEQDWDSEKTSRALPKGQGRRP